MSDPLALEFTDPGSGIRGWVGRGLPGIGDGEATLVLFRGAEVLAAGTSDAVQLDEAGGGARAEGKLTGTSIEVTLQPGGAADPVGSGRATVTVSHDGEDRSFEGAGAALKADPAAINGAGLVRTLAAVQSDGSALGLRSAREPDVPGHSEERTEAWLLGPDGAAPAPVEEPLLSTQYDRDGDQMRAGLELWVSREDQAPLRGAGTRVCGTALELDGWRLQASFFDWTVEGVDGSGSYMLWRRK